MIVHFTDSECAAIFRALSAAYEAGDESEPHIQSALRKISAWTSVTGGRFTAVTGDDAVRFRAATKRERRPDDPERG